MKVAALALAGVAAGLGAMVGWRAWLRSRVTPEERERRRRAALVARGKVTDATLVEIRDDVLFYAYVVRGVEYTACQDISGLREHMPGEPGLGAGAVSARFDAKIPANSIVLSEEWSGLHGCRGGGAPSPK